MEADIKALLVAYRSAIENLTRWRLAIETLPDLELQVSAPLVARQESRVQAAETQLNSLLKRVVHGHE